MCSYLRFRCLKLIFIYRLSYFSLLTTSCSNVEPEKKGPEVYNIDLSYQIMGNKFFLDLYEENYKSVIFNFDSLVLKAINKDELTNTLKNLPSPTSLLPIQVSYDQKVCKEGLVAI